jgi:hypothetical protein
MDGAALRQFDSFEHFPDLPLEEAPPEPKRSWTESELEFLTRRAMEERLLATKAPTAAAAAAHLYLSASYSAKLAAELSRLAELEKLALTIPD